MKAVLIRISTQDIIKKADYPKNEIAPIVGLDPDLKWLLVNQLAQPPYDPFTEKLVRVEEITVEAHPVYPDFDQYKIYWNIVALTAQEQTDYQQNIDDNDASASKHLQYKADGQVGFDRAYALIQRKFDNGLITGVQASNIATSLYPVIEPLYKGLWQLAKVNIDAQVPPVNAQLLDIFNKVKTNITNYVNDNY